jgi:outer membrane lipoprotein SlyB
MRPIRYAAAIIGFLALTGCVVAPPTGPSVMVLPGKDKSFEAFQADDAACRQYASAQIGNASPADAATQSGVGSTVLGTVLGGAAGAAIGAAAGNPAAGAAIGAGAGLVTGGAAGLNAASASGISLQQRYDMGYLQCMSAKGENVPAAASTQAGYPYYPYYPYYPPYYPYYPYYYGPAFVGFGASFAFIDHGGHHGHHFHGGHDFHGGHGGGHNFQHGHH